jgi:hypothetical protein
MITGEPIPATKSKGDQVFSGTMNRYGFIEIRTTKLAGGYYVFKDPATDIQVTCYKKQYAKIHPALC